MTEYKTPLMSGLKPSSILFPVVERDAAWMTQAGDAIPLKTSKVLVGRMLNSVGGQQPRALAVVNSTYKLVSNYDLLLAIENEIISTISHDALSEVIINDKVSYGGRDSFREYLFPHLTCDVEKNRAPVAFRIIVRNSYGGGAIRVLSGAIDFYCTNGMITGVYDKSYAKHTSGVKIDGFARLIRKSLERFVSYGEKWRRWHATEVSNSEAMELLRELATSPRNHDALMHQFMGEAELRGSTLWSVYSAATYAATHNKGAFLIKRGVENEASVLSSREIEVAKWVEKQPEFA